MGYNPQVDSILENQWVGEVESDKYIALFGV